MSETSKLWPKPVGRRLYGLGVALSVLTFISVLTQRNLVWHGQRDLELTATYQAFLKTGVLLIKTAGTGSYNVQAPGVGEWVAAAWDDDPGAYIVASLAGLVTHSASPYPGLTVAVALLLAVPMVWLPTAIARLFKSQRAGYSIAILPIVMWLTNNGVIVAGTQYGARDNVSSLPVYALYGIASGLVFFSLSLVLLVATIQLRLRTLILVCIAVIVLAVFSNLARSLSGMGIAATVGLLWWLKFQGTRWRKTVVLAAVIGAIGLTVLTQNVAMAGLNSAREHTTQQAMADLPNGHGTWHPIYLGLSWPTPVTGEASAFDVKWDDLFGWAQARVVDPDVVIGGEEYDTILKDYYLDAVSESPLAAIKLYIEKLFYVIHHFAAMIVIILMAGLLAVMQRPGLKRPFFIVFAIALPTVAFGLIPPVLVMPMLYYYSELTAALSLLMAVSLGVFAMRLAPSRPDFASGHDILS